MHSCMLWVSPPGRTPVATPIDEGVMWIDEEGPWTIEHEYLSGWHPWPNNDGSERTYETEREAEKDLYDFWRADGHGYRRDKKRIVRV